MTKLYAKAATAQAIATKLSKAGTEHEVTEVDGQWGVFPVGGAYADAVEDDSPEQDAAVHAAEAVEAAAAEDTIAVMIPDARLTAGYVITPPMGGGKKGKVERWFDRARIKSAEAVDGGVKMVLSRKSLLARKIDPNEFAIAV